MLTADDEILRAAIRMSADIKIGVMNPARCCWMSSKVDVRSINEIRKLGIDALAEALGPVYMARFLQSFDLGSGDYTKERKRWLDQSLEAILEEIMSKRKE